MENQKQRPLAVTIMAILMIIGGIGSLTIGTVLGLAFTMALGIAYFVTAYGLLKGKRWAWTITLTLSVIQITLSIASIAAGYGRGVAIPILINALIIYYLFGRNVKEFFGKR